MHMFRFFNGEKIRWRISDHISLGEIFKWIGFVHHYRFSWWWWWCAGNIHWNFFLIDQSLTFFGRNFSKMLLNVHQVEEIAPYRKVYLNNWANPFQNDFIFFSSSRASLIMKFLNIQITDLSKSFRQGRPIKIFFFESLGGLQEDFVARRDFFPLLMRYATLLWKRSNCKNCSIFSCNSSELKQLFSAEQVGLCRIDNYSILSLSRSDFSLGERCNWTRKWKIHRGWQKKYPSRTLQQQTLGEFNVPKLFL